VNVATAPRTRHRRLPLKRGDRLSCAWHARPIRDSSSGWSFLLTRRPRRSRRLAAMLIGGCGAELPRKLFVISRSVDPGIFWIRARICSGSEAILVGAEYHISHTPIKGGALLTVGTQTSRARDRRCRRQRRHPQPAPAGLARAAGGIHRRRADDQGPRSVNRSLMRVVDQHVRRPARDRTLRPRPCWLKCGRPTECQCSGSTRWCLSKW
jgi:hypothetical protein